VNLRGRGERLERALHDALRADVDPRARGHLPVHHEAALLELAEVLPGRPLADQVRVRDQHPRRFLVRAEHTDCPPALHQQRLVVLQPAQLAHDRVIVLPAPRRLARAAVDHQILRALGHIRIEVVHQHPQRGLLLPAFARQLTSVRGSDRLGHGRP
jgi:hypothetical protein